MASEFLERKRKAIDAVVSAFRDFQQALQELPPDWRKEILDELAKPESLASSVDNSVHPSLNHDDEELPSPSDAVRTLLRANPEGMRPSAVVKALLGKIRTSSANEAKLLYSILATLRRGGQVERIANGRYRLTSSAPTD